MKRIAVFVYGLVCYGIFFATFLYAFGFVGNVLVPKSMDSGPSVPLGEAFLINSLLLAGFAVQHSVMARSWFKRGLTKLIPEPAERSTYVLLSSVMLILLFWKWQPMGGLMWSVDSPAVQALFIVFCAAGWVLVLLSTFLINHFDLFGLRQVWLYLLKKPYTPLRFRTPAMYKVVRHPLYLGWLLAFWMTPVMTAAHLLFAVLTTAYILIAIQFEERDLVRAHGESYRQYRNSVPMILPVRIGNQAAPEKLATDQG
jgi:protein-S-isoprenylcysteine O-methyltransferase Ste14